MINCMQETVLIYIICSLTLAELNFTGKDKGWKEEKKKEKKEIPSQKMPGNTFFLITFLKAIKKNRHYS